MKTKLIILIALIAVTMSGCLVKSLHPFYTEKDLVFKPELTGNWLGKDSASWEIKQHKAFAGLFKDEKLTQSYDITYTDKKGTSKFLAHLFTVNQQLYLDFYLPDLEGPDLAVMHLIPAHTLAKVELANNQITIKWYNEEWLVKLFNENRIRIGHERIPYDMDEKNPDNFQVVLTAPTADLQKFIIKYGNDPAAFKNEKNESDYTFVLKKRS
ncbi:MAG: hypothetical protein NTY96_07520 [Bacteroidetes bacterium]|nr:hypothetical protein [Bacteroidota bacterium]